MLVNLKNKIKNFSSFLVAFSGGMDSTVLLHQLIQIKHLFNLNIEIRAIHIHHGLSIFADDWLNHCKEQCKNWEIPLIVEYITIKHKKLGLEATARKLRYDACFKHVNKNNVLITAHHINDQCETFFLSLKRSSGPCGLSSMHDIRYLNNKILLRPFIDQSFEKILCWAKYHKLKWIDDDSNNNLKLDRNFLRKKVLPIIYNKWPYFAKSVYKSALLCREQEKLIDYFLYKELKKNIREDGSFFIDTLKNMYYIKRNALLRRWILYTIKITPSYNTIVLIWKEIINSRIDASPILKIGNYHIRRYKNAIYLVKIRSSLINNIIKYKNNLKKIILPQNIGYLIFNDTYGIKIRKPKINEKITIRFSCKNIKYIKIFKYNHSIKTKKIWQKFSIPVWQRDKIPMLFYNDKLIAFIGIFITEDGNYKENKSWKILFKKNN